MQVAEVPWVEQGDDACPKICANLQVYSLETVFRTCYIFTDRCYLFLSNDVETSVIKIHFAKKTLNTELTSVMGDFCNELINQQVRSAIANETKAIRELIVTQAFVEGEFTKTPIREGSYDDDPRGIAK